MSYTLIVQSDQLDSIAALGARVTALEAQTPTTSISRNSNFSLANSTDTVVAFTTTDWNTGNTVNLGSGTITVSKSGIYLVTAEMPFSGSSNPQNETGRRNIKVLLNGTSGSTNALIVDARGAIAWENIPTVSAQRYLFANDVLRLMVAQDSGSAMNVGLGVGSTRARLSVTWLHE